MSESLASVKSRWSPRPTSNMSMGACAQVVPKCECMSAFETSTLPSEPTVVAPDGSNVRVLLSLASGSMAHFELKAGVTSRAVAHRTVEEIWLVVSGRGEMWRRQGEREEVVALEPGVCLTIPLGTHFQFRASSTESIAAVGVTMPPWPGEEEATLVSGPWQAGGDGLHPFIAR